MKFHLLGEDTAIEIDVLNRNFPDSTDYWDGNWVVAGIRVKIPGYSVQFQGDLRTDELMSFLNALKLMDHHLGGKAVLSNMDSYLHIEGEMDKLGNITWSVETCYPAGYGAVLTFEFNSDQSFLEMLIKELISVTEAFPVIGKP